jgi:hypothetical protein
VEDYGLEGGVDEGVPADELQSEKEQGKFDRMFGSDQTSRKKMAAGICCCVIIVLILGIVLGVTLGGGNDDPAPAPREPSETTAPTPRPTPQPTPVPTASPTFAPIPEELVLQSSADTFIYLGAEDEELGPFGQESFLLVQNAFGQPAAVGLVQFDISVLPEPSRIESFPLTATLVMQVENQTDTVTIETIRFQSNAVDIEKLPSFQNPLALANFTIVPGPSFNVTPNTLDVSVDITQLIFAQPPFLRGRRLRTMSDQLFLGFRVQSNSTKQAASVRFSSSEGNFPPQLTISIDLPGNITAASPGPSPGPSPAPSVTASPSASPGPSSPPSVSASPIGWAYFCNICGEGNNVTNPEGPLDIPIIGEVTCEGLQTVGDWGGISEENCDLLLPFVNAMCCGERFVCSICSDGSNITNPDAKILDGSTCATLASRAAMGLIVEADCPAVQATTGEICCEIEL